MDVLHPGLLPVFLFSLALLDSFPAGEAILEFVQYKKGAGRISTIHPADAPVSLMSVVFRWGFLTQKFKIRRTEPCGLLHDGGPEPYDRLR